MRDSAFRARQEMKFITMSVSHSSGEAVGEMHGGRIAGGGGNASGSTRLLDVGYLSIELLFSVTELRSEEARVLGGALLQALPLLERFHRLLLQNLKLLHY